MWFASLAVKLAPEPGYGHADLSEEGTKPHAGSPCSSGHQEACLLPPLPHAPVTSMSWGKQPWGLSLTAFSLIAHHDPPGISILNNFWPYFPFLACRSCLLSSIFISNLFNCAIKQESNCLIYTPKPPSFFLALSSTRGATPMYISLINILCPCLVPTIRPTPKQMKTILMACFDFPLSE